MKLWFKGLTCVVISLLIAEFLHFGIKTYNNIEAMHLAERLAAIPFPAETELIEVYSHAGKPVGNGNGIQLLAALLLKSNLSESALRLYYSKYEHQFQETSIGRIAVEKQLGREILLSINEDLYFATGPESDIYYIICTIECPDSIPAMLDLRGH